MVLQNINSGSADSMTVGCMGFPSWQDCVQEQDGSRTAWMSSKTPRMAWTAASDSAARRLAGPGPGEGEECSDREADVDRALAARSDNLKRNLPSFKLLRKLGSVGAVLVVVAYAVYLINPIEIAINVRMIFANGSFLYGLWRKPPVQIYVQVYIFNITNPREFIRGEQKLRLQEIGPFVYREELENTNVTFNSNDTVSFIPRRTATPVPEMSIADPRHQRIVMPNLALLGLASSLHNSSIFANLAFSTLATYLNSQPFISTSVHDYLWGFDEPLVTLASKLFPKWITFPKLGLLDRMFDDGVNVVTMNVVGDEPAQAELEGARFSDLTPPGSPQRFARRPFAIDSWNGSPGLLHWGYGEDYGNDTGTATRCSTLRGATEGILFPRDLRPDMQFSVYRKAFCRTLPLQFVREGPTPDNVPAFWYTLADNIFDTPDRNPDNTCYCRPHVAPCLPRGLSDLTPCYYDIPAAVSLPHFYGADESLLQSVEGLKPNKSLHATTLAIQPRVGVPLAANIRVQTNLVIHKTRVNPRLAPFNNLTLPIFWVDLTVKELPDWVTSLLDLMLVIGPAIQTTVVIGLSVIGGGLILLTAAGVCCTAGMLHATSKSRRPVTPIWNGKYSQVRQVRQVQIIPVVKAEHLLSLSLGRDQSRPPKSRA